MYSKNGDYFVSYHTVVTPQYNTKLVSASDAPKGWEDLLAQVVNRVYELQIVLLKRYYELQCAEQEKLQIRYHKGFALHNCGAGYLGLGQKEVARRYITLAHIEDVISHGVDAGGMAKPVLLSILGVPAREIDDLSVFTEERHKHALYPEEVLLAFQAERKQSRAWESQLFHPNLVFARSLLGAVTSASTADEKGRTMEQLGGYLLSCVDGLELAESRLLAKDHETDLLLRNGVQGDPLFEVFGPYIGIECKNWDRSVGVKEVNHFLSNLRFAYLRSGVLVARNGISGSEAEDKRDAELAVLKAFHQDNVIVCVLTLQDLQDVVDGRVTMPGLLLAEYERIRFDKRTR